MNSIETLKQELITQKDLIERLSGQVIVANTNPSPSEITAGIKTIPSADLTYSTATEEDVVLGKTFYSGNAVLKTGTANFDSNNIHAIFMVNPGEVSYDGDLYYSMPVGVEQVRPYAFYQNANRVHITFNDDLTVIDDYSFYFTTNFVFNNFDDLTNLKEVGMFSFSRSSCEGMDFTNVPNSVETINTSAFAYVNCEGREIRFPDNLKVLGQSAYRQESRVSVNSVDLSNFKLTSLPAYTFFNMAFACDLNIPSTVTSVGMYLNQEGCFSNITIPSSVASLQNYCFGCRTTTAPLTNFYLRTVTFEGTTPPTFGTQIFAPQNIENGFKIYVPDEALDEYKNVANLAYCVDCIYPLSEKE